jgi:Rab-GTPase-TBC domain
MTDSTPSIIPDLLYPLKEGLDEIDYLITIFKNFEKISLVFLNTLTKLEENFEAKIHPRATTLANSFQTLKSHIKNWIKQLAQFIDHLKLEIFEPLSIFSENLNNEIDQISLNMQKISSPLLESHKALKNYETTYYKNSEKCESLQRGTIADYSKEEIDSQRVLFDDIVNHNIQDCLMAGEEFNMQVEIFEKEANNIIENIRYSEETRIYFIKTTIEKYVFYTKIFSDSLVLSVQDLSQSLSVVNSKYDSQALYGGGNPLKIPRVQFQTYQTWKESKDIEEVDDGEIVFSTLDLLIFGKKAKHADFTRLHKILKNLQGKEWFVHGLELRKSYRKLGSHELTKLANILKNILKEISMSERDNVVFINIIELSDVFHTENEGKKLYLWSLLSGQSCFKDEGRWLFKINSEILNKISIEKILSSNHKKKKSKDSILSSIKLLASKFQPNNKASNIENIEKKAAMSVLYENALIMKKLAVDSEVSRSVILTFCIKYSLMSENIADILTIIQPPLIKNHKGPKKPFSNTRFLPFQLALSYLTAKECVVLLLVKKSCNEILYPHIISKYLLESKDNIEAKRPLIWAKILKPSFPDRDYYDLLSEFLSNKNSIKEVLHIIDMDVIRSYHEDKNHHSVLKNILKVYAYYKPEVNYCQGMNFIVGTIYFMVKDEQIAFNCLYAIIKRFSMESLLGDDFSSLKCMFYKLEKLIEYFLPDVHEVFSNLLIPANCYSSSWFLTLFSSCLCDRLDLLIPIWDYFIVKGWKVIFKFAIYALQLNKKEICSGSYETVMRVLKGDSLFTGFQAQDFLTEAYAIKISSSMLSELENNYKKIIQDSKSN